MFFKKVLDPFDPMLPEIKKLYETSFPKNERRDWEDVLKLLSAPAMILNLIVDDNLVIGFCTFWNLSDFIFLEHLAIKPFVQGRKHGQEVIRQLKQLKKPIVLETELPTISSWRRRINFYTKNGFYLLPVRYYQPPYRRIDQPIEMCLFSTVLIQQEKIDLVINEIKRKVYPRFS